MSEVSQTQEPPVSTPDPQDFDAFLSYTHSDRPAVSGIQKGLHRIGRRPGQLRALRVFRDDTDLAASPDLWGRITDALDRSRFLIVTLSPQAAASHWVDKEIRYWLEHRGPEQLMLVVAAGQLRWDDNTARFDPQSSDAAPPSLTEPGSLLAEPLFIDVSSDEPWDYRSPTFRDRITALAAPIHGKPKDQLASDDLREQRRFRRLRAAAFAGLVLLTAIAIVAAVIAFVKGQEANRRLHDAVVAKLNAEGAAMLAGAAPGGDTRAIQELLAANAIEANGVPILNAQIARFTTEKIIDTSSDVFGLAYSPDGTHIATAELDGTVRRWESATGKPVGPPMTGHQGRVAGVTYTPDGHTIASVGADGMMRLWNADTGSLLNPQPARVAPSRCLAVSPDGQQIVTCDGGNIRFWNPRTGQLLATIGGGADVSQVTFDRSGNLLAAGRDDGSVAVYDTATRNLHIPVMLVKGRDGNPAPAWAVAFSPDEHSIAVGSFGVQLWNVDTGALDRAIRVGSGRIDAVINVVAFSPDGERVATGRNDGSVQLWEVATGAQLGQTMTGHTAGVTAVAFSPDGGQIATASLDKTLRLWNANVGQAIRGPADDLQFSPDGKRVAAAGDAIVAQWDVASGQLHTPIVPGGATGKHFRFVDGGRIVTAADDGTVQLWNASTGQPASPPVHIDVPQGAVRFAFSGDGRSLATGEGESPSGAIRLWDVATGRALGRPMTVDPQTGGVDRLAFSPDGRRLAAGYGDGLRLWNVDTTDLDGPVMSTSRSLNVVASLAFNREGTILAAGLGDGAVDLWNLTTRKPLPQSPLRGHTSQVLGVAFGTGNQLVSGAIDGSVRLWDTSTATPTAAPLASSDVITSVALSPDGRLAASGHIDQAEEAVVLSPAMADPAQLCDKLIANMSHRQWRDWVSPAIKYIAVCRGLPVPAE
ncbi:toll/interleukin-1 receptor domain-containing protein [Mycobacterium parmense]|uniref:toll/interleukin-1 receptor domain-containing protein n=1 Tax=Mycobacterium parmense TaxID=185642 RepID=UPI0021F329AF|nr:TIR domain-containing protein [Mycobacterium parmense]